MLKEVEEICDVTNFESKDITSKLKDLMSQMRLLIQVEKSIKSEVEMKQRLL